MGIRVDPFLIPVPKHFLINKEDRAYFEYLNRFLHDLWVRTGGGNDAVDDSQISEVFGGPAVSIKDLEIIALVSGSTNIISTGDQFIVCNNTAAGTITLNLTPEDGEDVFVARKNGSITVNGKINGNTAFKINGKRSSIHFKYTIIADEWTAT